MRRAVVQWCVPAGGWYRDKDLLPGDLETVIDAASALDDTVRQILRESGLDRVLPIDR
ncbi:hypothetical protein [Streptomyces sp. Je 1-332]|uniref:hypothetical protein n=1 Tax=Streptomyces sp. Je 1-332 TaxID=3231270 RepID=UPI00345952AB